ncbi:Histone deacetylase HDT1 [Euphorbia peplus]|nr:Histone deacetylase HDT1 [Euphorbia peplus]
MEFWGVEVKAGAPLKVSPDESCCIHLSQAALADSKKGNESVCIYLKNGDGQKLVLGHLSLDKIPQMTFDVVLDKEVELSHNSKNSVFFIGYQTVAYESDSEFSDEESDDDVPIPLANAENGVPVVQDTKKPAAAPASKPAKAVPESSSKQKSKPVQPVKDSDDGDDTDDSGFSDDDEDDSDSSAEDEAGEGMSVDGDDSEDDDDSSSEEETPKKAVKAGSKRTNDSAIKTPVSSKKQKAAATPQKTDGKKSVHTATPHPAKKTKANGTDSKQQQTPKSGAKFTCSSCEKPFNSDGALQSHTKAKHSAK